MASCKGTCTITSALKAIPHVGGRTPNDPATGRRVPSGTYGPWKRCRTCEVLIVWQGRHCPCCGVRLSVRPWGARHRRSARITAARQRGGTAATGAGGNRE